MRTILHTSLVLLTLATSSAYATTANRSEAHLSKADLKSQAMELCRAETEQRYGVNTIKRMASKSSWSSDLQAELVKIKIKPASKRPKKFYCVVKADKTIDYVVR
jgi:hypothetical protein